MRGALARDPDFDPFSMVLGDIEVALHRNYKVMFSTVWKPCRRVLAIGGGTAGAERTFSRVGRILSLKRSNLTQQHLNYFMVSSANGPDIQHPKQTSREECAGQLTGLIVSAFEDFCRCPCRLLTVTSDV